LALIGFDLQKEYPGAQRQSNLTFFNSPNVPNYPIGGIFYSAGLP
jgi:hypothetical protein